MRQALARGDNPGLPEMQRKALVREPMSARSAVVVGPESVNACLMTSPRRRVFVKAH